MNNPRIIILENWRSENDFEFVVQCVNDFQLITWIRGRYRDNKILENRAEIGISKASPIGIEMSGQSPVGMDFRGPGRAARMPTPAMTNTISTQKLTFSKRRSYLISNLQRPHELWLCEIKMSKLDLQWA